MEKTYLYYKTKNDGKLMLDGPYPDEGYPIYPGTETAEQMVRLPVKNINKAMDLTKERK